MAMIAAILGRICIAILFILAGAGKVMTPAATGQYMAQAGLPSNLAMVVGIFEIAAGVLLAVGFMTRLVSVLLIGFTALATIFFHSNLGDVAQQQMALKNLAIIGGLLMVFAYGQVSWRMSTWKERHLRHDAEVQAARAEARADAFEAAAKHSSDHTVVVDRAPVADRTVVVDRDPHHRTIADRTDGDPRT